MTDDSPDEERTAPVRTVAMPPEDAVRAIAKALGTSRAIAQAIYDAAIVGLTNKVLDRPSHPDGVHALLAFGVLGHPDLTEPAAVKRKFGCFYHGWHSRY